MEIINFDETPSLVSQYMAELRDITVQTDPLRFRHNLERIGQIMAYEISKTIKYRECIYNRLLLNNLQLISQKYGRNF